MVTPLFADVASGRIMPYGEEGVGGGDSESASVRVCRPAVTLVMVTGDVVVAAW